MTQAQRDAHRQRLERQARRNGYRLYPVQAWKKDRAVVMAQALAELADMDCMAESNAPAGDPVRICQPGDARMCSFCTARMIVGRSQLQEAK